MAKPDPLSECRKKLAEVDEAGEKVRQAAAGVFASVREIKNILSKFQEKQPLLNEKTRKATEKAVWRKCLRLMRRAEWQQRYVMRYQKHLTSAMNELQIMLPSKERSSFQSQNFPTTINSYGNGMSRYVSRRDGKLSEAVRGHSEEAPAFAEEVITNYLTPLEAELSRMAVFMEKNKKVFLAAVQQEHAVTINVETFVERFFPAGPFAPQLILVDADFIGEMEAERVRRQKMYYDLQLPRGKLYLPRAVMREITHLSRGKGLAPRKLLNYLLSQHGAEPLDVAPSGQEKNSVIYLWRNTPKGRTASPRETEKFRDSGDMEILVETVRQAKRRLILILSNDTDVAEVCQQLSGNINIVSYRRGQLVSVM